MYKTLLTLQFPWTLRPLSNRTQTSRRSQPIISSLGSPRLSPLGPRTNSLLCPNNSPSGNSQISTSQDPIDLNHSFWSALLGVARLHWLEVSDDTCTLTPWSTSANGTTTPNTLSSTILGSNLSQTRNAFSAASNNLSSPTNTWERSQFLGENLPSF